MTRKGKPVFVANARSNKVDEWTCVGEFNTLNNGKLRKRLCFLSNGRKFVTLPKRCVFETREAAQKALNRK